MEVLGASKHGGYQELDWKTVALPAVKELRPTDVLIQVAYSDVNPVDLQKLQGGRNNGQPVQDPPFVPGFGGSGTVLAVGKEAPPQLRGQAVCFLADPSRPGSYATHIVVDYHCVATLPPGKLELRDAASIPVAGLTALESLGKVGLPAPESSRLAHGNLVHPEGTAATTEKSAAAAASKTVNAKTMLVIGGAGGVGSWAITLARAWYPSLRIVATASTKEQQDWCLLLGADQVVGHDEISKNLQGGREGSVDAILCLTEPTQPLFDACAELIKPYGSICLVVAGKSIESLNLSFVFFKCANVVTQTVFSSIRTNYQHIVPSDELATIVQLLSRQTIKAPLSPDLESSVSESFKDAKKEEGVLKALSAASGKRRGKYILRIQAGHDIIFIDFKTASFLQVSRRKCIQSNVLHPSTNNGTPMSGIFWKEQVPAAERNELVEKLTKHPTLGIVKVSGKTVTDYEDGLEMQEAANVQNLWGVKLKKRTKNAKGEELLFVDPLNGVLGEVSRVDCVAHGFLTLEMDSESGKETVKDALTVPDELDEVIQTIRKGLKLNLEG